ncbi:MAG: hypothetical protein E7232_02240 [Lachnospiraceae bacterium]|nr:hypothetical protein [Lachnospiraceae bacterium]
MRRKFKKAVTLLASLTISVSQIQTPAMAENVEKDTQKEVVDPGETIDTNNGEICINYGTVKDNSSNIGENKGKVEDNKGSVKTNEGTIDTNHENAEVGVNTGEIGTNKGLVGSEDRNETINHGTIDKNETHLEINAGKNDTRKLDWNDEKKAAYTGGTIKDNNSDVSINNGTIESNNTKGSVEENNGTITENYGSVTDNNNGAVIDDNQGAVTTNYGKINENNSEVSDNFGEVNVNNGEISNNDEGGYVKQNLGIIGTNDNGGFVDRNYGSIEENGENGQVSINIGNIEQNYGLVGRYSEDLDPDNLTSKDVDESIPTGLGNFGEITENYGIITKNAGKDDAKHADLSSEDLEDFEGGNVGTNTGLIIINNGTVEINEEDGLIFENNGTVNENTATVTINSQSGIVANYEGGVVAKNTGKVYNYGGVIKDKSTGTEYFSVSITSGSNMSRSGGSNLVKYEDDLWLGQTGTDRSYTEIIITPSSDYALSTIKVPDSLKDNVSVSRNRDGSWTIRVTSGTNISFSIPNAIYVAGNDDSGDDSGDDGRNPKPGNNNPDNNNNPIPGQDQKDTPPVTDNLGNTLNVDLSQIIKSFPDKTTAMNSTFSSPMSLDLNQIQGYGTISLKKLFEASPTSETITVPVAANVKAGTTYKIYFSNGTSIDIACSQDGLLSLTLENSSQDLSFIIYGEALTPSTGDNPTEPGGPSAGNQTGSTTGPVAINRAGTPASPGRFIPLSNFRATQ